jgi:glycogen operon protein
MDLPVEPIPDDRRLSSPEDAVESARFTAERRSSLTVESCRVQELGARVTAEGVYFAVYSRHAYQIHLALFPPGGPHASGGEEILTLPACHGHVFQGFVPGIGAGWTYGFYAEGPFDPRHGHRFNPGKFLLDPYARAIEGTFRNPGGILCGHVAGAGHDADLLRDHRSSRDFMPKGLITRAGTGSGFDWQGVKAPNIAREDLVIYEVHVKGFTADASSGVENPGTFLGLIEKIPYLKSLGINAVELLPVHAKASEDALLDRGLVNYWGYNSASFFALEPGLGTRRAPGCEIEEFKTMVRELHRAGIEVILDVVYNHTAEGSELGPTLSLRGLDNLSYYSLTGPEDAPRRYYHNYTGCGNTVNFGSEPALRLVLDSLRYFAEEMRVDGFRFDLATVHGRQDGSGFSPRAPFFYAVAQDPVLRGVKLIAEGWDLDTYGVGKFPEGWMEWNDDFRDNIRRWVRGEPGLLFDLRDKLEGSPFIYADARREPWASVNFITAHDGFTLRDLVSYNRKHNQANGEDNRDGSYENRSWNCGSEGPAGDPALAAGVEALRGRQARNHLLLTLLARGTPMLLGGDEFLRTQDGNNNAYCQDNEVSWFDWKQTETQAGFLRFFKQAVAWRRLLAPANSWTAPETRGWGRCWQGFTPAGKPWTDVAPQESRQVAFLLREPEARGEWLRPPDPETTPLFYLLLNTMDEADLFQLPFLPPPWEWELVADTSLPPPRDIAPVIPAQAGTDQGVSIAFADRYKVPERSTVILRAVRRHSSPVL